MPPHRPSHFQANPLGLGLVRPRLTWQGAWLSLSGMPLTPAQLRQHAPKVLAGVILALLGYGTASLTDGGAKDATASSNLALTYFHAGASVGAYVERVRPGLPPQQLLQLARNHYATLGPDPYLSPQTSQASVNTAKAMQALATTQAQRHKVQASPTQATNASPQTNSVPAATNTSPPVP